jgi:hypothetical protein
VQDPNLDANPTSAKYLAVTGSIDGTGDARVDGWSTADVQIAPLDPPFDNSADVLRGDASILVIEASTTFDYADLGFLAALGLPALSVTATHEQRAIRD